MNSDVSGERKAILSDLLKEKNLWTIYRQARLIPTSRVNTVVGATSGSIVFLTSFLASRPNDLADQIVVFSNIAFISSINLLGFLLAGFAFFATVSDKSMFCRMAEVPHTESGLSYLKYNFFSFLRVFVEYIAFALLALATATVFQPGNGVRQCFEIAWNSFVAPLCSATALHFNTAFLSCVLAVLFGAFVYLLMQLKSFIFNIYHVVMTSIRWTLEYEYANDIVPDSAADRQFDEKEPSA